MRAIYFDPVGGAAGDMILGALLDLGAPLAAVEEALATLPVGGYRFETAAVEAGGLKALRVTVTVTEPQPPRTLADLLGLLAASGLRPAARARAERVFRRLAAAEARVHAVPAAAVHFHEVGAVDALIDIAGTAVALDLLAIEAIRFGPLEPGAGLVETAHGTLPVPAPATLELLTGVPIRLGGPPGEWVTPTGAALLTALGEPAPAAAFRVERVGAGAGRQARADRPNVIRALLGELEPAVAAGPGTDGRGLVDRDEVVVLEAAIDDQAPVALAHAAERLRAAGALDVTLTAISMKKGRAGTLLTLLARPAEAEELARRVLGETTTLGLRWRREERRLLGREVRPVSTPYGIVGVKETRRPALNGAGEVADGAPETEDVARAAGEHGVPFGVVAAAARRAWEEERGGTAR